MPIKYYLTFKTHQQIAANFSKNKMIAGKVMHMVGSEGNILSRMLFLYGQPFHFLFNKATTNNGKKNYKV